MVALKYFVVLLSTATICTCQDTTTSTLRTPTGVPANTMRRFPHHVNIQPLVDTYDPNGMNMCGGSILNDQWILTSIRCVEQGDRLQVDFRKLHRNNTLGSYSAVVNNDDISVVKYPTEYDDIALLRMPFRILFSDIVQPIAISTKSLPELEKKLAILPGFDDKANYDQNELTYGMLSIISNGVCLKLYGYDRFDEFLQMCTKPWANNRNTPCISNFGSGLIVGWPAKPEIIGIYSASSRNCDNSFPAVYANVVKYQSWINSIINY